MIRILEVMQACLLILSVFHPITFGAPVLLWQSATNRNDVNKQLSNGIKLGHKRNRAAIGESNVGQQLPANENDDKLLITNKDDVGQSGSKQWSSKDVQEYLKKYGYLVNYINNMVSNDTSSNNGNSRGDVVIRKALEKFQVFTKLPVTGIFDAATEQQMNAPRCHLSDDLALTSLDFKNSANGSGGGSRSRRRRRRKRYVLLGSKWSRTSLTYNVINYASSPELTNHALVDYIIMTSLNDWSAVTPITFRKVTDNPDIKISFEKYDHWDNYPFDGPGGVLAHAFMPEYGLLHFDDSEKWTSDSGLLSGGVNLRQVSTHEMGHVLGLGHTDVTNAVMYPYFSYKNDFRLQQDDLDGIHYLYGGKSDTTINVPITNSPTTKTTTPTPTPPPPPTTKQKLSPLTPQSPPQQPLTTPLPVYNWWIRIVWLIW